MAKDNTFWVRVVPLKQNAKSGFKPGLRVHMPNRYKGMRFSATPLDTSLYIELDSKNGYIVNHKNHLKSGVSFDVRGKQYARFQDMGRIDFQVEMKDCGSFEVPLPRHLHPNSVKHALPKIVTRADMKAVMGEVLDIVDYNEEGAKKAINYLYKFAEEQAFVVTLNPEGRIRLERHQVIE